MGQRAHVVAASRRVVEQGEAESAICLDGLACLALGGFEPGDGSEFAAMPAPELTQAGYRGAAFPRSEEHTSELQSLMRISYAVFCLKKKINKEDKHHKHQMQAQNRKRT